MKIGEISMKSVVSDLESRIIFHEQGLGWGRISRDESVVF